jgi:hypothetical protein
MEIEAMEIAGEPEIEAMEMTYETEIDDVEVAASKFQSTIMELDENDHEKYARPFPFYHPSIFLDNSRPC